MNKQVTVLSLKDEIIKSYGHVYFEWSKQLDIELEVAAWLLNLDSQKMYRC
jgi:F0F1-type ATP synthase alpha subunit